MSPTGAPTYLSTVLDGDLDSTALVITTLLVLLFGSLFSVAYSTSIAKKKNDEKKYARPWPKVEGGLPFIGNTHQIMDLTLFPKTMKEWADKYSKEYGCFEVALGGHNWVVVCNEDRMKEVMGQRPDKIRRSPRLREVLKGMGMNGIIVYEGEEWQKVHRIMAPMFNKNHVRDYMQYTKLVTDRLITKFGRLAAESGPDGFGVNADMYRYAMDSTFLTILGKDVNTLKHPQQITTDLQTAFNGVLKRHLSPIEYWKIPFVGQYLDGTGFAVDRMIAAMGDVLDRFKTHGVSDGDGSFVAKLVQHSERGRGWDNKEIIGNLASIYLASIDTTGGTLCFAIQQLIEDETGFQDELVEELQTKLPAKLEDVTIEDLSEDNVPLLNSFFHEVVRYEAVAAFFALAANEDIPFCGTTLKKDTEIFALFKYCNLNTHQRPKATPSGPNGEYEDHTQFHPRRWLVNDKKSKGGYTCQSPQSNDTSYMSFGYGPQQCLGRTYEITTMAYALAAIVRSFRIAKAEGYTSPGRKLILTIAPDADVRVVLTKRE